MDKVDKNEYDIQAAAAILGIDEDKLKQMITRGEVEARDENGVKWISKSTIAKLFDKVSNDQDDPGAAKVIEKTPAAKKIPKIPKKSRMPRGAISLEEEYIGANDPKVHEKAVVNEARKALVKIFHRKEELHLRVGNMLEHIEKLNYRIQHMRKIEEGLISEFWLKAGSAFKQITHNSGMAIVEHEGHLIICPSAEAAVADSSNDKIGKLINRIRNAIMPDQIKDSMIAAIKAGKLPPDQIIQELGLNPDDYHEGNIRSDDDE